MNGSKIFISLGGSTPFAGTKTNNIRVGSETIEIASLSQDWKTYIAGRKDWSCSIDWLLSSGGNLSSLLMAGQTYTINIICADGGSLTGSAICTEADIKATLGSLAQGSFQFQGSGELQTH